MYNDTAPIGEISKQVHAYTPHACGLATSASVETTSPP